ncbi:hypothetical protein Bhyg_03286 [Pseudolycoriella hygida]|uniref:Uncharacterized protein n=1 Tax=Pseudolycoriella hygida TaxID=35572 RepID=A0A9Q0NEL1_9DIPT|nr:hypothetical protein Bhyg_03286 [Pseudolycoriella hygida]
MFSPLLKSCFPYALHPLLYDEQNGENKISVLNSRNNGNGNAIESSSCGIGKRYLPPPCEPPPPTPLSNARRVAEIEYAVPFLRRYENASRNGNAVIYENSSMNALCDVHSKRTGRCNFVEM